MPLFYYACSKCQFERLRILSVEIPTQCPKCGFMMERTPKPPTAQKMEVIDNGYMAKRVERPVDIEDIIKERSDKHTRETIIENDKTQKD